MLELERTPCLVVLLTTLSLVKDYCQRMVRFMEYTCQFARCPTGVCPTVPTPSSKSAAKDKGHFPQYVYHLADRRTNLISTMLFNNLCLPSLNIQARPACTASLACRSTHSLTLCRAYSLWSLTSDQLQCYLAQVERASPLLSYCTELDAGVHSSSREPCAALTDCATTDQSP